MDTKHRLRTALKWTAGAIEFASAAYATYVAVTWVRYGNPPLPKPEEADALLDRFMPDYEVAERHHIHVAAPAEITLAAACEADLMQSPVIRAVFRTRELILGSQPDSAEHPWRAGIHDIARMARARQCARPRNRYGRGDAAVERERRVSPTDARSIRRVQRAGLREDCVDVARRSRWTGNTSIFDTRPGSRRRIAGLG